jgi:YidC/Oxa1 family membrane protein insertase
VTTLSKLVAWILAAFYSVIPNYAVAIILLGLTFMVLVVPLTLKSTRSMLAMQKLQPKMKQLQQQHKNDRIALNQALTELYKQEGVSPFGSCLPAVLPLPLFYVLYRVINGLGARKKVGSTYQAEPLYLNHGTKMYKALVHSAPPGLGAQIHALGLNLATSAWSAITKTHGAGEVFGSLLLLFIMIGANYYQQVQITNLNPMVRQNQQANPQMQMMRFFPILFGFICIRLPSGLVLYYAVSALFRVGQQWMMYRYDPKVKALVARDDRDIDVVEARLEELEKKPSKQATTKPALPKPALPKPATAGPRELNGRDGAGNGKVNGQQLGRSSATAANQRARNRRRKGR